MSRKDYTKFSSSQIKANIELDEIFEEPTIEEEQVEQKVGTVVDCTKLNVRRKPNPISEVVCEIPNAATVLIDDAESTNEFYKICTSAGIEGYCMKKFIEIL